MQMQEHIGLLYFVTEMKYIDVYIDRVAVEHVPKEIK